MNRHTAVGADKIQRRLAGNVCLVALCLLAVHATYANADSRPNIVLIMADDMGYSDVGCYGGEISTPHINALAEDGLRFTQFYNTGRCCPTRASLMTGLYPHEAGLGHMVYGDKGPGYHPFLNQRCLTIAEVLGDAGYRTMMTGNGADPAKWELYDMTSVRTETNNVARENPERLKRLANQWTAWAKQANVLPWPKDRNKAALRNQ